MSCRGVGGTARWVITSSMRIPQGTPLLRRVVPYSSSSLLHLHRRTFYTERRGGAGAGVRTSRDDDDDDDYDIMEKEDHNHMHAPSSSSSPSSSSPSSRYSSSYEPQVGSAGDWTCKKCGDLQFRSRKVCRMCGQPKPGGDGGNGEDHRYQSQNRGLNNGFGPDQQQHRRRQWNDDGTRPNRAASHPGVPGQSQHGILAVDKPAGSTSRQVVDRVSRILGEGFGVAKVKTGHGGTLDPFATGVCVIGFGWGTRSLGKYQGLQSTSNAPEDQWKVERLSRKTYEVRVRLGERTDSLDRTGTVTETKPFDHVTSELVLQALKSGKFGPGIVMQRPPAYSAIRVNGQRLHEMVREGRLVEQHVAGEGNAVSENVEPGQGPVSVSEFIPERPVQLHAVKLLKFDLPYFDLHIDCGHGFYVRRLVDDLGLALGTVAHSAELRRTASGDWSIDDALPESEWTFKNLMAKRRAVRGPKPASRFDNIHVRKYEF